jgi:hypothetical protein
MECLITFFVLLTIFVLVTLSPTSGESRSSRRRNYQNLAREFSGVYLSGGLFRKPRVRFRYGETLAFLTEVSLRGPYRGRCTQIQINWPDPTFRAEVLRKDKAAGPSVRVMSEVTSGVEQFDHAFLVHGDDEQAVRQFLSEGVRWQIDRLCRLLGDNRLYILITHGRIHIQKPRIIRKYGDLRELLQRSLELYDQAMITAAEGIKFVEDGQAQALENVICKVCGEEIVSDMVYCQRCKTPHHGECWSYAGACSVYGCQEKSYSRPQAATPISQPHTEQHEADQPESSEGLRS